MSCVESINLVTELTSFCRRRIDQGWRSERNEVAAVQTIRILPDKVRKFENNIDPQKISASFEIHTWKGGGGTQLLLEERSLCDLNMSSRIRGEGNESSDGGREQFKRTNRELAFGPSSREINIGESSQNSVLNEVSWTV